MKGQEVIDHIVLGKMPDTEQVRENCHRHFAAQGEHGSNPHRGSRMKRLLPITAAVAIILAISTTVFAAFSGFEWFVERFNPRFAGITEPVMLYSEDQGIRMTVIGAQNFGNSAVLYMSVQDVSGQNRLTRNMHPMLDLIRQERGFSGLGQRMLSFDEKTNTAYFEMQIDSGEGMSDPLIISSSRVVFEMTFTTFEPLSLSLAEASEAEIEFPFYLPRTDEHWISGVDIIDGQLRVQSARITRWAASSSSVSLYLRSPSRRVIDPVHIKEGQIDFVTTFDEQGWVTAELSAEHPVIDEFLFDIDVDNLEDYTLLFSGGVQRGIGGNWQIEVYTSGDAAGQSIILTDIQISDRFYGNIILTPINMLAEFTVDTADTERITSRAFNMDEWDDVYIEFASGTTRALGGYSIGGSANNFNQSWQLGVPIDISEVAAIIINGERISITE